MNIYRLSLLIIVAFVILHISVYTNYASEIDIIRATNQTVNIQEALKGVLEANPGVEVLVKTKKNGQQKILVYDLVGVSGDVSSTDVFRVFLQFSEKVKDIDFSEVELLYRGEKKFLLKGNYFQKLGKEYSFQNPVYTVRTFPENVMNSDGTQAFPKWTGGWLGVSKKQMEDFNKFNRRWYLNSWIEEYRKTQNEPINP